MATDLTTSLANAIQRFEGWTTGSLSQRNNNPGNLRAGPGMIGTDQNGFAIFPDYTTGYNALLNQVQLNIDRGLNLNEFFAGSPGVYAGYAPSSDNNRPLQYASTVSGWIGIDPTVPLNSIGAASVAAPSVNMSTPVSGALIDLSGSAAATPTASIMDQISTQFASAGVDVSSTGTGLLVAAGIAAAVLVLSQS